MKKDRDFMFFMKKFLTFNGVNVTMKVFQTEQFYERRGDGMDVQGEMREVLCKTDIFRGMSAQTENVLLSLPVSSFSAGDTIANEKGTVSLGVLLAGKASIYGRSGGNRVLLNRLERASVFDAATVFFSENETVSTVVAKTKCRVLFIERPVLETIIENDPKVAHDYILFLSDKIGFLNRKIIAFTAKNADAALAGYLLDNAGEDGLLSVNMTRIASILDIGRTTLYRAVDALEKDGCIAYDGKKMRILDRETLESRAKN